MTSPIFRRTALAGSAAALFLALLPHRLRAQDAGPIRIGALSPLTGAGGPYGPSMVKAARSVVD